MYIYIYAIIVRVHTKYVIIYNITKIKYILFCINIKIKYVYFYNFYV